MRVVTGDSACGDIVRDSARDDRLTVQVLTVPVMAGSAAFLIKRTENQVKRHVLSCKRHSTFNAIQVKNVTMLISHRFMELSWFIPAQDAFGSSLQNP